MRVRQAGALLHATTTQPETVEPAEPVSSGYVTINFALSNEQCPDWANFKRPDIYSDRSPTDPLPYNWDGWTWADHARAEGLAVSREPQVGDIAVWPETALNPPGHVAYVEAVEPVEAPETPVGAPGSIVNGTTVETYNVTVSEMNASFLPTQTIVVEGIAYTYEVQTDKLTQLDEDGVLYIGER